MTDARLVVALFAIMVAIPAAAQDGAAGTGRGPRPSATLDVSFGGGSGDSTGQGEPQVSLGLHLTGRPGPIVLAADLEVATNVFGSGHTFATVGAGGWIPLGVGRLLLVGLVGRHSFKVFDLAGTPEEHDLPTAGGRASWELAIGRKLEGRLSFAGSCYADMEREPDSRVGDDVGGVTVLLSVALGLGI